METTRLEFSDIYDEFHESLTHYLERMVGRNHAEDLAQEVFIKIDKGLKDFKGKSSLSTWVYRIATNAALDMLKSRALRESKDTMPLKISCEEAETEDTGVLVEETNLSAE